eukprot:CAMPEP_0204525580 /NCGR_PEP_ID=MMETSP0661-20131031/7982_1 /ASSEMBLY_ACC=CAM_ASM_000606 /TAXON_ID=109239 /ORGANISM="Alexandrium margalefi, Strain AMGDE01CS-322" /LENGTH=152 /DNA_ID=CAMNT_0051531381 /DNA_START=45 /DNA_END=501 /DNA_ORIENTATION=+
MAIALKHLQLNAPGLAGRVRPEEAVQGRLLRKAVHLGCQGAHVVLQSLPPLRIEVSNVQRVPEAEEPALGQPRQHAAVPAAPTHRAEGAVEGHKVAVPLEEEPFLPALAYPKQVPRGALHVLAGDDAGRRGRHPPPCPRAPRTPRPGLPVAA